MWFWLNFSSYAILGCLAVVIILWAIAQFLRIGLTPSSTRTPPALSSAHSLVPASSASLIASAQAWPLSFFR